MRCDTNSGRFEMLLSANSVQAGHRKALFQSKMSWTLIALLAVLLVATALAVLVVNPRARYALVALGDRCAYHIDLAGKLDCGRITLPSHSRR